MNDRINATRVLARRRVQEALISPGFYLSMTIGLVLAYLLVSGFVRAIDSSGFDYTLDPVYDIIGRSLEGAFGAALVEKLFAEGPFLLSLYVALLPVLLYLAVGSVFRIGLERKIGALELVSYGPADGTSVLLATFIADLFMTVVHLLVLLAVFAVTAGAFNLALGPAFFSATGIMVFLSFAVFGYGLLASTLTDNSASAIAVFLGLMTLFVVLLVGSFTIVSEYVRSLSTILASIVNWVSPLFYWNLAVQAAETRGWLGYVGSLIALAGLGTGVLVASHFVLRSRGVRP